MPNGIPDDLVQIPNDLVPVGAAQPSAIPNDLAPVSAQAQQPAQPDSLQDTANRFLSAQQATAKLPFDDFPSVQKQTGPSIGPANGDVKEQFDSPTGLETNVSGNEQLARAARRGLEGNLAFKLAQLGGQAITGQKIGATAADAQDQLNRYSLVSGLSQFADPAGMGIFKGAEKMIAEPVLSKMGLGESYRALLDTIKESNPAIIQQGIKNANSSARSFANQYLFSKLMTAAVAGGAGLGAYDTAQDAADQALSGRFDPKELVESAAKGLAKGAAFSAGLTGLASGLAKASQVASALKTSKGLKAVTLSGDPTVNEEISGAFEDALQHVRVTNVPPEQMMFQLRGRFMDNLENRGIKLNEQSAGLNPVANLFARQSEKFAYADKTAGTETYPVFMNFRNGEFENDAIAQRWQQRFAGPLQTLYKNGVSEQEAYHLLNHMEDTPQGDIVFNPAARLTPGSERSEYLLDPPVPGSEVHSALQELRHNMTSMLVENPEFAGKTGYIPGYVPLMDKKTGQIAFPQDTARISQPGIMQPRTGAFDPAVHEDNLGAVLNSYINQYSRHTAFAPHLDGLWTEMVKLRAMGQEDTAQELANMAMSSMGIKQKIDLSNMYADKFLADKGNLLQHVAQNFPKPDSFLENATKVIRDQAYKQWIFSNPMIYIRHAFQPEFVAGAEIGPENVAAGRAGWFSKELRDLANKNMPLMKSPETGLLDKVEFSPPDALSTPGKVKSALSVPGKVLGKTLSAQDTYNRQVVFIGAYKQFQKAFAKGGEEAATAVLDGLNYGERSIVRKAMQQGGPEAAAQMYGVMRTLRSQYAYSIADTANAYREGIGKYIPFTTWGSNQLMRFAGDVADKNYAQLAKRIVLPLLYIEGAKQLTGYEIPKANPIHAVGSALGGPALAGSSDIVNAVSQEDPQKFGDALLNLTPAGTVSRAMRNYKNGTGDLGTALGLKKVNTYQQKPSFYQRFMPKIIKRALSLQN